MQPYKLPDFYMPYPARLNPHLETARVHTKAWAREMGILDAPPEAPGPNIWDERKFDSMDFALSCAYIHPDTPSRELDLLTDWYVWGFYFDDHFLDVYKRSRDLVGAKAYLEGLPAFMPIDLAGSPPEPTNPVERGLIDLWARAVPLRSLEWQRRFFQDTKDILYTPMWELANISESRIPNPIEYIEMRRKTSGALWTANFVEHAAFVEIPARITDSRPMRVLKDTFADWVSLVNDLFSYQREIQQEGEISNCVFVLERFLDLSPQQAADLTNDILTSRLHQFEHTALTELPFLFEEYGLNLLERESVLLYVKGLQDFLAGSLDWHRRSSRYMNDTANREPSVVERLLGGPTGLGTSAAQVTLSPAALGLQRVKNHTHVPYESVGPTTLPAFYMPYTARINVNLERSRQYCIDWARQMGMLESPLGGIGIWDEENLASFDPGILAAKIYPDVSGPEFDVLLGWLTWGFYVDDYFPAVFGPSRDMARAKVFSTRLSAFMPLNCGSTPAPTNPVETGLADLWIRTASPMTMDQRCQFRQGIETMTASWLWELANYIQHRIPDPIDYVEMRRKTMGSDLLISLARITQAGGISPEILFTRAMKGLKNSAEDYVGLLNDIFSYQKEIEFEGELNNCVLVVQKFLNIDRHQAVLVVNDLMTARLQQFEHIIATELPLLVQDYNLNADSRKALDAYVLGLQDCMVGNLDWHMLTRRYDESALRRRYRKPPYRLGGPTGLGTSATLIDLQSLGVQIGEVVPRVVEVEVAVPRSMPAWW